MQRLTSSGAPDALRGITRTCLSRPTCPQRLLSNRYKSLATGVSSWQPDRTGPGLQSRANLSAWQWPRLTRRVSSISSEGLRKTPLYDLHVAHGAKMVPFGGFHMPVQYDGMSVSQSHTFTRTHASLFDVSHMVQRRFDGPGAAAFLQRITPSNLETLPATRSTLSCLLHADGSGGIVDDTVVAHLGDGIFYVVTNAACREKDDKYLAAEMDHWNHNPEHVHLQVAHMQLEWGLIALQGPEAVAILEGALADPVEANLKEIYFGQIKSAAIRVAGGGATPRTVSAQLSRGGYTGEDGFEIAMPVADTVAVTEALLASGGDSLRLAGLGARDSLRLEAGMCLYGHDLDDTTTPVEAGLSWIIPKERRTADAGFYGADTIAKQLIPRGKGGLGVQRRRVGLLVEGAPAREGAQIVNREDGAGLGTITSGCPSPTLGSNIAMGYIKDGYHKAGTEVHVVVRGRQRKAVVTKMPFVPTKYWKGTVSA